MVVFCQVWNRLRQMILLFNVLPLSSRTIFNCISLGYIINGSISLSSQELSIFSWQDNTLQSGTHYKANKWIRNEKERFINQLPCRQGGRNSELDLVYQSIFKKPEVSVPTFNAFRECYPWGRLGVFSVDARFT